MLAFGLRAARKAAFPLAFLLFMVPLPGVLLQYVIRYLQDGVRCADVFDFPPPRRAVMAMVYVRAAKP